MQFKYSYNRFISKFIILSILISINAENVKAGGFWTGFRDDYIAPAAITTKNFLWDLIGIKEDLPKQHVVILEVKPDNESNPSNKSDKLSQTNSNNNLEVPLPVTNNAVKIISEPDKPKDLVQIITEKNENLGKVDAEKLPKESVPLNSNTDLSQDHQNSSTQQFPVQPSTSTEPTTNPPKLDANLPPSQSNKDPVSKIDLKNPITQPENPLVIDKPSEEPHSTKQVEQLETQKHGATSTVDNHLHLQEKESNQISHLGIKTGDEIKTTATTDDKSSTSPISELKIPPSGNSHSLPPSEVKPVEHSSLQISQVQTPSSSDSHSLQPSEVRPIEHSSPQISQVQTQSSGDSHSLQPSEVKPIEHSSPPDNSDELAKSKLNFKSKDHKIDNKIKPILTDQTEEPVKDGHELSDQKVHSAQPVNENQHQFVANHTGDVHEDDKNHRRNRDEGELHQNDQLSGTLENPAEFNNHLQEQFHKSSHTYEDLNSMKTPKIQSNFQFDIPFEKEHFKDDHQFQEQTDQFFHHGQEENEGFIHDDAEHDSEFHENDEREEQIHQPNQFGEQEPSTSEEEISEDQINYEHLLKSANMEENNVMKSKNKMNPNWMRWKIV